VKKLIWPLRSALRLLIVFAIAVSLAAAQQLPTHAAALAPTVASLQPASGGTGGGTVVTIQGANLSGASKVVFGSTAGTALTLISSTSLKVTAPAHTAGAVDVRVTTPGGTSAVTTTDRYTYTTNIPTPVTALTGSVSGSSVTLTWTNPSEGDFTGVMIRRA
jgi:hypothetical protein